MPVANFYCVLFTVKSRVVYLKITLNDIMNRNISSSGRGNVKMFWHSPNRYSVINKALPGSHV